MKEIKVYLAAPFDQQETIRELRDNIHQQDYRVRVVSRWHDMFPKYPPEATCAMVDLEDIRASDVVVINAIGESTKGGMWVELGVAIGLGKRIVYVGEKSSVFTHLQFLTHVPEYEYTKILNAIYSVVRKPDDMVKGLPGEGLTRKIVNDKEDKGADKDG